MTNSPLDLSFTQDPIWREERQKQYAKLLEALDELTKRDAKELEKYFVDGDFDGPGRKGLMLLTQIKYFPLKTPAAWDYIITRNGPLENPMNIASHIYTAVTQSLAPLGWTPEEIDSFADYMGITDTSEVIAPTVFERLGVGVATPNEVPLGLLGKEAISSLHGLLTENSDEAVGRALFYSMRWKLVVFSWNHPHWLSYFNDLRPAALKPLLLEYFRALIDGLITGVVPVLSEDFEPHFEEMKAGLLEALRTGNLPQVLLDEVADLRERA